MRLARVIFIISWFIIPVLYAQSEEPDRGFDKERLEQLNGMDKYDYDRSIPPPDNYLFRVIAAIAKAVIWLFSNVIGYILLIGLVVLLIWTIVKKTRLGRSKPTDKQKLDALLGIQSEEDLKNEDLDAWIKKSLAEGNHRYAIRFTFLKLLQLLIRASQIKWEKEKTNYNYLDEMNTNVAAQFRGLLITYEYVWYGEFAASAALYDRFANGLTELERSLDE